MTTIITRGAASAQALGYAARSTAANYIEDVFSTYLYAGNGGTQTITNSIDLSTKGGLVWIKNRTLSASHALTDTARGVGTGTGRSQTNILSSDSQNGSGGGTPVSSNDYLSAFTTTGFTVVSSNGANDGTKTTNRSSSNYVAWSFAKQAKFFDIVTYTGTGANRTISHNLGSVPGCIIIKRTNSTVDWAVYHRSLGNNIYATLNSSAGDANTSTYWNNTNPTSSVFTLGTDSVVNANGGTYVAYLFAHNAGGFGASGTDNVITCDQFPTDETGVGSVTLGYEPQFIIMKCNSDDTVGWAMIDNMRGWTVDTSTKLLANTSGAEAGGGITARVTSTGFTVSTPAADGNYIYIAIRRGPMRTPTSGTSVFSAVSKSGNSSSVSSSQVSVVDLAITKAPQFDDDPQTYTTGPNLFCDRMRGLSGAYAFALDSTSTAAEASASSSDVNAITSFGLQNGVSRVTSGSALQNAYWFFRRAPGFFDEVCYTGTGSNTTQTHNLGVVPELMIVKRRNVAAAWAVYSASLSNTEYLVLNTTAAKATGATRWNSTTPTSTVFSIGTDATVNANTGTYVAYLFATVAGVSKVGSYTGSGTTKQIDCGFTGGARFVLIKRTDSTGDWYVWDSARGIVAGNDPYLLLNSTAAEVTNTDYVDTYSAGFELSSTAPAAINANGGTFIFLAIA